MENEKNEESEEIYMAEEDMSYYTDDTYNSDTASIYSDYIESDYEED